MSCDWSELKVDSKADCSPVRRRPAHRSALAVSRRGYTRSGAAPPGRTFHCRRLVAPIQRSLTAICASVARVDTPTSQPSFAIVGAAARVVVGCAAVVPGTDKELLGLIVEEPPQDELHIATSAIATTKPNTRPGRGHREAASAGDSSSRVPVRLAAALGMTTSLWPEAAATGKPAIRGVVTNGRLRVKPPYARTAAIWRSVRFR